MTWLRRAGGAGWPLLVVCALMLVAALGAATSARAQPGTGSMRWMQDVVTAPAAPTGHDDDLPPPAVPGTWSPTSAGVVQDRITVEQPPVYLPQAVTPETTFASTVIAIKVVGGLLALLALAYLGGHKRVVRFQERFGLGGVITAGFAFVALGLFARQPTVGILTDDVLLRLQPVLHFGLGWLGFIIGAQLDIRVLDRVPKGTAYLILVETLAPFAVVVAGCGALMIAFGRSWSDPYVWRDVIVLGAAAAMTAPRRFRGFANRAWRKGRSVEHLLGQLDELAGIIVLVAVTAIFRDVPGASWQLPSVAWIFMSCGIGLVIGVLIFAMVRVPTSNAEFLAVVLGGIAFGSGFAGYLRLSPTVVCFLAGVLVTNFPNDQRGGVFKILNHLDRPVRLLFLIIAGALWRTGDWRGWALVPVLVGARIAGKWLGITASRAVVAGTMPESFVEKRQLVTPLSSFSIALVVSVEVMQESRNLPWVLTAVIGGALLTEIVAQLWVPVTAESERASESQTAIVAVHEDPVDEERPAP